MEIFPSEYQSIELSRYEKLFVRHALSSDEYGIVLLKVNPAMISGESLDVIICSRGVLFCKFFDELTDANVFNASMTAYAQFVYPTTERILLEKLLSNKAISKGGDKLNFPTNIVHVFPGLKRSDVGFSSNQAISKFIEKQCLFAEEFSKLRSSFSEIINCYLDNSIVALSADQMTISNNNVNSVLQRIAPEYVTVTGLHILISPRD